MFLLATNTIDSFSSFITKKRIFTQFVEHLFSDGPLLLEAIPKTDFIKALRKLGVDEANKLQLTNTNEFENHIKEGFTEATKKLVAIHEKEQTDPKQFVKEKNSLISKAKKTFKIFVSQRTENAVTNSSSTVVPSLDDTSQDTDTKTTPPKKSKAYSKNTAITFTGENEKTKLSSSVGFMTRGISLPPFSSAYPKFNCCTAATKECKASCLGFYAGGAKQYPETSFLGKLIRLQFMVEHPEETAILIYSDLKNNEEIVDEKNKNNDKEQFKTGFRANITSDLDYMKLFPLEFFNLLAKTQFYDYTKDHTRLHYPDEPTDKRNRDPNTVYKPKNYSLSLSHTGSKHDESNDIETVKALNKGNVITMVVYAGKGARDAKPFVGRKPHLNEIIDDFYKEINKNIDEIKPILNEFIKDNVQVSSDGDEIKKDSINLKLVLNKLKEKLTNILGSNKKTTEIIEEFIGEIYHILNTSVILKGVKDSFTDKVYAVTNGDEDDNVFDRHATLNLDKSKGVVSVVFLKGVTRESAGKFANEIQNDGYVYIDSDPKQYVKEKPIKIYKKKPITD